MIEFEAPAGTRILRSRFVWVTTFDDLWWSDRERRWVKDLEGSSSATAVPCRSYKAFLRHIRKHPELESATLCSRFQGHDIHYTKGKNDG